jgi:hypothetical protein
MRVVSRHGQHRLRDAGLATRPDLDGRLLATESRLEARVREAQLRLEAKIEASRADIIRWFVTSLFAQAAVIVALLKLLP